MKTTKQNTKTKEQKAVVTAVATVPNAQDEKKKKKHNHKATREAVPRPASAAARSVAPAPACPAPHAPAEVVRKAARHAVAKSGVDKKKPPQTFGIAPYKPSLEKGLAPVAPMTKRKYTSMRELIAGSGGVEQAVASLNVAGQAASERLQELSAGGPIMRIHRVEAHRQGLADTNRVGSAIEGLNHVKNLVGNKAMEETKSSLTLERLLNPNAVLSPDERRYCDLLQKPFSAPWGDEGELPVKPLLYPDLTPPSATGVCRQYGTTTITIQPGRQATIMCGPGPGNIVDGNTVPVGEEIPDSVNLAWPVIAQGTNAAAGLHAGARAFTIGAPKTGAYNAPPGAAATAAGQLGGEGVFGAHYQDLIGSVPNIFTDQLFDAGGGGTFTPVTALEWGSKPPYGGMEINDASAYKYRPVAGGIMVTPLDAELSIGGAVDAMIIPQATNADFVSSTNGTAVPGAGVSQTLADMLALPDHVVERADGTVTVAWLPGRLDGAFYKSGYVASVASGSGPTTYPYSDDAAENAQFANNVRMWIIITPPQDSQVHVYRLSYVGFYEVAGSCLQETGIVPRPQPNSGARVTTSVQNCLAREISPGERTNSVLEGAALEAYKNHPAVGPMVEQAQSMPEAKGFLSKIMDFGKEVMPLAALLL